MAADIDFRLIGALALVLFALALFGWRVGSSTRRFGLLVTESRVPRRYLLLGLAIGICAVYLELRQEPSDG